MTASDCDDATVRYSFVADSTEVASGTLTFNAQAFTESLPQDAEGLVFTARRTDSADSDSTIVWDHAGLE